ncbi:hypothetical protein SAMN04489761_4715 [Tenacibaculum sp. MAR_2009_124]|uniref:hypothetical protein n=1 Tax=Tenacibaculum sp. MAR_2009_124 TaxID=1250059 RepID=UPI000898C223|nr:hypothetical protein [Tenacibaculum sp. MAR_2009_124]SED23387.1 hypothetical protein SAMN04489761_4715 [Tenacibaculum sp. MAR_2009_124]
MKSKLNIGNLWSLPQKILFRFFFSYFTLFIIAKNNGAYPYYGYIQNFFNKILYDFVPWVGKSILGISYEIKTGPNGSGDTTYDYVLLFTIFCIAVISSSIWSILDTKRKNYDNLYYWITLAIRFYVGLMLINYGMVKVIQLQFSAPSMYRLTQNYGDSSPMGLAWTFLGFSKGYNLFMGIAEVAAVFLLFRRTLVFGLIITLMTTANVMAVNYFYDIPVKILSTHLFLMSAFLLAHSFAALFQFFFFRKPVVLKDIYKPKFGNITSKISFAVKAFLLIYALGYGAYSALDSKEKYYGEASKSRMEGLFEIEYFSAKSNSITPDSLKIKPWKYLMISSKQYAQVKYAEGGRGKWYKLTVDSLENKLSLRDYRDSTKTFNLKFSKIDSINYQFNGTLAKDTIFVKAKRFKNYKEKFLLTNRGFNWINERPFNR